MLTDDEKQEVLSSFPNVKLSYNNYKKVCNFNYDYVSAIAEGQKCFAWFTSHKNMNVCFILELTEERNKKGIQNIKIMNCCFNSELCYGKGTIFYGTNFMQMNNLFFSIEDIFYYKGKYIANDIWSDKMLQMTKIMKTDIKQISYNKKFIVFGLPIMKRTIEEINTFIDDTIKYKINSLVFRNFDDKCVSNSLPFYLRDNIVLVEKEEFVKKEEPIIKSSAISLYKEPAYKNKDRVFEKEKTSYKHITKREIIFKVRPDMQNDIYHLYCNDNSCEKQYDIAYIPDYETSVLMNKLFRNIKENANLDALEESDDEEEFQNEKDDRFVFLEKSYNMKCIYNNKFKKWVPISIEDNSLNIISYKDLSVLDRK